LRLENHSAGATSEKKEVATQEKSDFVMVLRFSKGKFRSCGQTLDLSILYILVTGTYSKSGRKINFLALGVYFPHPYSSAQALVAGFLRQDHVYKTTNK